MYSSIYLKKLILSVFGPSAASKLVGFCILSRDHLFNIIFVTIMQRLYSLSVSGERFDRSIGMLCSSHTNKRGSRFSPDRRSEPNENNNNNKRSKFANKAAAAYTSDRLMTLVLLWTVSHNMHHARRLVRPLADPMTVFSHGKFVILERTVHLLLRPSSRDQVSCIMLQV